MPFVIESGSKQYTVTRGQQFVVDRLSAEVGDVVNYTVLFSYGADKEALTTLPAKVVTHQKGKKIRVVKYKSKSNYHKQMGYRHFETVLEIERGLKKTAKPVKEIADNTEAVEKTKSVKKPTVSKPKAAKVDKSEVSTSEAPKKTTRKKKTDLAE